MTEDRVPTLNVITAHIEREARRIGTYHGDPAATPGGTGYCIPVAVATQIVDKYLSAQPAPPLEARRQVVEQIRERIDAISMPLGWARQFVESERRMTMHILDEVAGDD